MVIVNQKSSQKIYCGCKQLKDIIEFYVANNRKYKDKVQGQCKMSIH
jgi:hypothetical protein